MRSLTGNRLASLKKRMSEAFEADEWQVLAELDKECQQTVSRIIAEDPRAMFDELRQMLGFYADLIAQCQVQRSQYAVEVKQLRQGKKHRDVYLDLKNVTAHG